MTPAAKPKGHGRNGANDYPGAPHVAVPHETLALGDACPACDRGTLYGQPQGGILLRFTGQPPVQVTIYELEKLRCGLCGQVFTATPPEAASLDTYDPTVASMIGLLKYGNGLPFHRLDGLQENLGMPLPSSTQWEIVAAASPQLEPAYEEVLRQAVQGEVLHNDDTTVKILELMGERAKAAALNAPDAAGPDRTGMFTTGVVSTSAGNRIALFFSGRQHAGENLRDVLLRRATDLPPPIQMSDALSRNRPPELQTIVANCLAHASRQFVDVNDTFPAECRHVLAAIRALRKHWEKLTLFLRVAGAPLDNNLCERALKKAIPHRKNALFFKMRHGAAVGDLYLSLIHTCELNGGNPFEYLTVLQQHASEVATAPGAWMPWNERDRLVCRAGAA